MSTTGFQDLLRRARDGDERAMDSIMAEVRPRLVGIASRYADPARPAQSTADLLQDSYVHAWKKLGTFRGGESDEQTLARFGAWMGQIVRTVGLTTRRDLEARKRKPELPLVRLDQRPAGKTDAPGGALDPVAGDPTPSADVRSRETLDRLEAALDALEDESTRTILRMRLLEDLDLREIAARLDLPYKTAWNRFQAGLLRVQRKMKDLE